MIQLTDDNKMKNRPTRKVCYVQDELWFHVEKESLGLDVSTSEIIRRILKKNYGVSNGF